MVASQNNRVLARVPGETAGTAAATGLNFLFVCRIDFKPDVGKNKHHSKSGIDFDRIVIERKKQKT